MILWPTVLNYFITLEFELKLKKNTWYFAYLSWLIQDLKRLSGFHNDVHWSWIGHHKIDRISRWKIFQSASAKQFQHVVGIFRHFVIFPMIRVNTKVSNMAAKFNLKFSFIIFKNKNPNPYWNKTGFLIRFFEAMFSISYVNFSQFAGHYTLLYQKM